MSEVRGQFDLQEFVKHLTHDPGVYRMLNAGGQVIYVGKAKDLQKRVASYLRVSGASPRTHTLMAQVADMEVTATHSEAEALLLENNLIKQHRPRYNVLLRDDKSYPYIHISETQDFPKLAFHRGARRGKGRYFGPYPSAGAVRETLSLLQKLFRIRQCRDSFFNNRSRPCLQYQIDRCTAPCVGLVDTASYRADVELATRFLEGRGDEVIQELVKRMDKASERFDFEQAAQYRDRIEALRRVTEQQYVSGEQGDLDIIACALSAQTASVQVFNIRGGLSLGNRSYFPQNLRDLDANNLITAFLGQYYLSHEIPPGIIVSHAPADRHALVEMLTAKAAQKVSIDTAVRGKRSRWLEIALRNAQQALDSRLASRAGMQQRLEALQEELELDAIPGRMECFDISHTQGEATVASCVVFDIQGPVKSDYRRFNIAGIEPGDDYGAMRQALKRRYTRLKKGEGKLPDILFIDGGKGQVQQANEVLEELQVTGVSVIGIAKGRGRKPGLETLHPQDRDTALTLAPHSAALHLIQQIRDEAHRFAITGHRQRRAKARKHSRLEDIPGLGPKRRQNLLKYFGGLRGVSRAGVEELTKVPGISAQLAATIHDALH